MTLVVVVVVYEINMFIILEFAELKQNKFILFSILFYICIYINV